MQLQRLTANILISRQRIKDIINATVIKLKFYTSTPTTSDLGVGEVGIDTSGKKFYINDSGTIKEIGGGTSSGDSSSQLSGDVRGYTGDGSTAGFTVKWRHC